MKRSLFDPKTYAAAPSRWALTKNGDNDADILDELIRDEQAFDTNEGSGFFGGELVVRLAGDKIDLRVPGTLLAIPGWVEDLEFHSTKAKGILAVEYGTCAEQLARSECLKALRLIVVSMNGIPRVRTRRLLHRLSTDLKLPVYVLADNDTWGYFIFSVLKRGMAAPQIAQPAFAVQRLRHLGILRSDLSRFGFPREFSISQKKSSVNRLKYIRRYPCFRSESWKDEFADFLRGRRKLELDAAIAHFGIEEFVQSYLAVKLREANWLE